MGWQKYSELVLCKSRGNSGVRASTSRHWKPQESPLWRWFHIVGQCQTETGVAMPATACEGGSALQVVDFSVSVSILLCSFAYWAWVGQHPTHESIKSPGILFMTWRVQGVMNDWLLVFLSVQDVLSQSILRSSITCSISGCSKGSPARYRQLVVLFNPA